MGIKNSIYGIGIKFFLFLSLMISLGYFFNYLNQTFFHYSGNKSLKGMNKNEFLFLSTFVAPVIETVVFIWLPFRVFKFWNVKNIWRSCLNLLKS